MPAPIKRCNKCGKPKPITDFYQHKFSSGGHMPHCKACHKLFPSQNRNDPRNRLWMSSYVSSRARGIEHTIKPSDIILPSVCKYLGIKLDYRLASERGRLRSWNAPSIDRIDPARGYVPGNVQVISDLANRMKSDATVEQLIAFAEGILRVHAPDGT